MGIRFSERWQKGLFDSALTIGAVALAALVHFALGEEFAGRTPFLISLLVVMGSAVRGGLLQGLLATFLTLGIEMAIWGEWAWLLPDLGSPHFIEVVLFLIESLVISFLAEYYLNGRIAFHQSQMSFQTHFNERLEAGVTERTAALAETVAKLRATLETMKTLNGLLAICGSCKKIRDDDGRWSQVEEYLRAHSTAEFSHTLCPDCLATLRAEIAERQRGQEDDPLG